MNEVTLEDDFGRRTVFNGEKLLEESSDNPRRNKPQWVVVEVWRTQAGSFVVSRTSHYRVRHLDEECDKADGYFISPATAEDIIPCRACNKVEQDTGGWRQDDRITVTVCKTPQDLILDFQNDEGKFSYLSRTILADLAEKDDRVDEAWNTVVVP